jgi:hypothetical protein
LNKRNQLTNKFEKPLNRILELLILVVVVALGVVAFLKIMTPIESSMLYQISDFFRFSLFVVTLFLIMSFLANPLFKMLKVEEQ